MEKDLHRKYYNDNNNEVPSVTTILKVLNKPSLMGWANYLGYRKINYKDELERTAEIGTFVHEMIEEHNKRRLVNLSRLDDISNISSYYSILNCFNMYLKWFKKFKPKNIYAELPLSCDSFGGTMDCVCEINDKIYLIDYKTSSGVYPTMFLQLSAYAFLLETQKCIDVDYVAILRLDKKHEKYEFVKMKNDDYLKKYFKAFMHLYESYTEWTNILISDWKTTL